MILSLLSFEETALLSVEFDDDLKYHQNKELM